MRVIRMPIIHVFKLYKSSSNESHMNAQHTAQGILVLNSLMLNPSILLLVDSYACLY